MREQRGITLISLIITIIIMLILAGVALSMVVGDQSIVEQAIDASEETETANDTEQIQHAVASWNVENYKSGDQDIVSYLSTKDIFDSVAYFDETEKEVICKMSESQKKYLIKIENGEIISYDNTPIILDHEFIVVGIDDVSEIKAKYNHELGNIEWLNSNESVIKATIDKNVAKLEVVGKGSAVITAKVGEHVATCEIMVPETNSSGNIIKLSAGTKKQLLQINKLNEEGKFGVTYDSTAVIDITADIDMENAEWRPLNALSIKVNGNNHKISNLNCIQETAAGRSGFMGYGGGSIISDLILENVTAIGTQAGAFIGYANDGAKITNCKLIGNNTISWQQNTGTYKEDWSGIGALMGLPAPSSSYASSASIEGTVTIKYNNMPTYCYEADDIGALGFKTTSDASLDFHSINTTNATITKEGTWISSN